jgi:hypothetical protein
MSDEEEEDKPKDVRKKLNAKESEGTSCQLHQVMK